MYMFQIELDDDDVGMIFFVDRFKVKVFVIFKQRQIAVDIIVEDIIFRLILQNVVDFVLISMVSVFIDFFFEFFFVIGLNQIVR